MTRSEEAIVLFSKGFNCSQSVLAAFGKEFGLSEDVCLKIACAFGGGMGRRQLTCGAVTGALMVLGLKYGMANGDEMLKKVNTYKKTAEFFEMFKKLNGSTDCKVLLQGLDMNNAADLEKINELNLFQTTCYKCVNDAVEIVENIFQQD
jgi:C_GCAxxG_C_C family probable redox protein